MARRQASSKTKDDPKARSGASSILDILVSRRQSLVKVKDAAGGDTQAEAAIDKTSLSASGRAEVDKRRDEQNTLVFESYQQLCNQIVSHKLLASGKSRRNVLCLFMFGSQGSSMGELAFELVQHSGLKTELENSKADGTQTCPLYHSIDVTALVASNIDHRIRQYNQLRRGASNTKVSGQLTETILDESHSPEEASIHNHSPPSSSDNLSQGSLGKTDPEDSIRKLSIKANDDNKADFAALTLDTKQRSMLQLKLVKYFNSVSAKWLLELLQTEVERLEIACQKQCVKRPRVYLIKIIPNHLTLFKSCLYLKQTLALKEFVYPYTGIKFEKRTNVRVLKKERVVRRRHSSKKQADFKLRLALFRLSFNQRKLAQAQSGRIDVEKKETPPDFHNEKLEPKLNDFFEEQFSSNNRLIRVRYNPIYGPNEMNMDQNESQCGSSSADTENSELRSFQDSIARLPEVSTVTPQRSHSIIGLNHNAGDILNVKDTFGPLLSPSKVSVVSSSINSFATSEDSYSSFSRWPAPNATDAPTKTQIHWAVELKMLNRRSKQRSHLSLQGLFHSQKQEMSSDRELSSHEDVVYSEEHGYSTSSPASILLSSLRHKRGQQYRLTRSRIVVNEDEQETILIIEAKHVQPDSSARLKGQSDIGRLAKRIQRAKYLVSQDCQTWLCGAIDDRHKITASNQTNTRKEPKPELVVYVIPVDVGCINSASFKLPAERFDETTPRLNVFSPSPQSPIHPRSPIVVKSLSADGRGQSESFQTRPVTNRGLRHVQFKLMKPPDASQLENLEAEHRFWLEDHVFASWPVHEDMDIEQASSQLVALSILTTTLKK